MAKDADGNIIPEYEAPAGAYENELQQSGTWDDGSQITLWNPKTGAYETVATDPDDVFKYNPRNDITAFYMNDQGEYVMGYRDGADLGYNSDIEYMQQGYEAPAAAPPTESWEDGLRGNLGNPTPTTPTAPTAPPPPPTNPMDPYDPDTGTGNPQNPTDDWFWTDPVGYENAPQPEGDGSFVEGGPPADTSWNWDAFRQKAPGDRQWGGYDTDYQAFERYQPGMRSPWGMPNIEGGNRDFYQQQFVNQLRDEQGYQNRERQAQEARQAAAENPYEPTPTDWSWANNNTGLAQVQPGGAAPTTNWDLNKQFTPGESTQGDILRWASSGEGFTPEARDWYSQHLNNPENTNNDSTYWSSAGDPSKLIGNLPTDPKELTRRNQTYMTDLFNSIYNQGQAGPYAPAGYASPINVAPTAPAG